MLLLLLLLLRRRLERHPGGLLPLPSLPERRLGELGTEWRPRELLGALGLAAAWPPPSLRAVPQAVLSDCTAGASGVVLNGFAG